LVIFLLLPYGNDEDGMPNGKGKPGTATQGTPNGKPLPMIVKRQ